MRPSILIVDDEAPLRRMLRRLCAGFDVDLYEAEDGAQALALVREHRISVMLLDLSLPRLGGLDVLENMRRSPPDDVPGVIVVTSSHDAQGRMRSAELGAIDFVAKPFDPPDLERRVARVLAIVDMEQQLRAAERSLQELLERDHTTGVEATAQLYRALDAEYRAARTVGRPLSCVVVSDETLGREGTPPEYDPRLRQLASLLDGRVESMHRVFRVDVAEFVVLMPGWGVSEVREWVRDCLPSFRQVRLDPEDFAIASVSYPHPELTQAAELYRALNVTLAQARTAGRVGHFAGF